MTHNRAEFIKQIEEITGLTVLSTEDRPAYSTLVLGKLVIVDIFYTDGGWGVWHVRINSDVENELYKLRPRAKATLSNYSMIE